ncbi:hypothetical protein GCM10010156_44440 [Planobispora rosea]|uniref:FtsX-like permease family protein n=1 Tax=Planobispora rosea TaxID=35762 RepID=A0A8J3S357_PLARO|nr:FtsX-like permease family protein [Planobispora rosea]GGS80772.1 hypothetical protein GCM10010156_44440 [Planobispora rosea]GIH85965.1 hypothetical protein Pro02_43730 [Planobispora rosea]
MITVIRMPVRGRSAPERARARLMSVGAALATFLLCAAVTLVSFRIDTPDDRLWMFTEREPRLVVALTLALLVVPAAVFTYQASRLATATRERRLAALRLAGATPYETRLIGAYEAGRQALLGGSLGGVAHLAVNVVLWWSLDGVVPLLSPVWTLAALAAVVLAEVWSGLAAGRHVVASPLGLVRRARLRGPRAVDLLLVALGVALLAAGLIGKGRFPVLGKYGAALSMTAGMVLLLFGLVLAATWLIRAVARRAGRVTAAPETLLAARIVQADPRAWARALTVVGLTVFFGSGIGAQQGNVLLRTGLQPPYLTAYLLIDLALLLALVTSAAALVVHQAEELLDHRRSFAALAASGVPATALGRVLTRQALIAASPVCVVAAVAGAGLVILTGADAPGWSPGAFAFTAVRAAVMAGIGVLAAVLVARASRRILREALRPEELRTG